MPSKFFTEVGAPESFKEDMGVLTSLTPEELSALAELVMNMLLEERSDDTINLIAHSDLVAELGLEKAHDCINATQFVLRGIRGRDDTVEELVDDLVSLEAIQDEERQTIIQYFRALQKSYEQRVKPILTERGAVKSALPWWKAISTVVDLRAIIPDSYGLKDSIDDYEPTCTGFSPIAIISLSVEDFEEKIRSITFQADENALERLVACLVAAQKDLEAAKRGFGENPVGG